MKTTFLPFIFLFSLPSFMSCSLFSSNHDLKENFPHYIDAQGYQARDLKKIRTSLEREVSMAGGIYHLKLMPLTSAYLEAYCDEQANLKNLEKEDLQNLKDQLEKKLVKERSCFQFDFEITKIEKMSQAKEWKLIAIEEVENQGEEKEKRNDLPLLPLQEEYFSSKERPLTKSFTIIGSLKEPQWSGRVIQCTFPGTHINFKKDFSLKVIAQYAPFPFERESEVNWIPSEVYPQNGDKDQNKAKGEKQRRKKKNYQRYRNW